MPDPATRLFKINEREDTSWHLYFDTRVYCQVTFAGPAADLVHALHGRRRGEAMNTVELVPSGTFYFNKKSIGTYDGGRVNYWSAPFSLSMRNEMLAQLRAKGFSGRKKKTCIVAL